MLSEQGKTDIGKRIREVRISNGYTQAEFAECINISVNFLSEIENGKKGISYETLYNICDYFTVSADFILFGHIADIKPTVKIIELSNKLSISEITTLTEYLEALKKMKELQ
ncbi:MAG: helix-turn-helix domain-containing protein [Clostridium sp.]|nr:helix-turn-helix domain-containing protein [Clostridium sp.]